MTFELPKLPYEYSDLEPYIDAKTMEIHYSKHHQTYVNNLNNALKDFPDLIDKPVEDLLKGLNHLPEQVKTSVRNNGGGHFNHSMFWKLMKKEGGGDSSGKISSEINSTFGTFDKFKEEFTKAALGRFGSGWTWLVSNKEGKLQVLSTPNQDNPLTDGFRPILGLDVWEHAYYLLYQNRRADYISAWWNIINWDQVNENFSL